MLSIEKQLEVISTNFLKLKEFAPKIQEIADICYNSIQGGGKILFCGNGGSASDAQHLATELVARYKKTRKAINALALSSNTALLTAISNDNGFEKLFERQIEAYAQENDVLIAISTSGNSENIINAVKKAKSLGLKTIGLTGQNGGMLKLSTDYIIQVPSDITNNVQEMHIAIGHIICDLIEQKLACVN